VGSPLISIKPHRGRGTKFLVDRVEPSSHTHKPARDFFNFLFKLPQEKIEDWIERIPVHVQKVIELEGGNDYKAGDSLIVICIV